MDADARLESVLLLLTATVRAAAGDMAARAELEALAALLEVK